MPKDDRADLTKLERAEHIAEWVRLTEEKMGGASCAGQLDISGRKQHLSDSKKAGGNPASMQPL